MGSNRRLDEHLGDRLSILGDIMIAKCSGRIRVIKVHELPVGRLRLNSVVKYYRITPDWKEMLIKTLLESCSELVERHSQISFRQVHTGNSNRPALAYLRSVNDVHHCRPSTRALYIT